MIRFLCEDQPESILTAIYDAFQNPAPNDQITIEISSEEQFDLFTQPIRVNPSYEKALKVMNTTLEKLGAEVHRMVEGALSADASDKAQALFQFYRYAFRVKHSVVNDLARPEVMRIFELNRKSRNEAHLLTGFVRFEEIRDNVFFSRIGPKNDVLPLLADFFSGRFNTQAFVIYDEKREKSVVYTPGKNWYFLEGPINEDFFTIKKKDIYEDLWSVFFHATDIEARSNPIVQRTLCPIHFRKYMNEFNT